MSVVGLAVSKPPPQVSAAISISGWNSTPGLNSISGSTLIPRPPRTRELVTMAEDGPAPGRVTAGVGAVSQAPERNPTCRTGRCNLRYSLDLSTFLLPAIIDKLLTDLGKIAQTAKARM